MIDDKLVMMANQIARAFKVEGEARALPQIRAHVERFWDPRMRAGLAALIAHGGAGLDPLALKALADLKPAGQTAETPNVVPHD